MNKTNTVCRALDVEFHLLYLCLGYKCVETREIVSIPSGVPFRNLHCQSFLETVAESVAEHSNQTMEVVSCSDNQCVQLCEMGLILCKEFLNCEKFDITVCMLCHLEGLDLLVEQLHSQILSNIEWTQQLTQDMKLRFVVIFLGVCLCCHGRGLIPTIASMTIS